MPTSDPIFIPETAKSDPVLVKPRNYIFVLKITINITNLAFCWAIEIVACKFYLSIQYLKSNTGSAHSLR
jgi:hypothetical protein